MFRSILILTVLLLTSMVVFAIHFEDNFENGTSNWQFTGYSASLSSEQSFSPGHSVKLMTGDSYSIRESYAIYNFVDLVRSFNSSYYFYINQYPISGTQYPSSAGRLTVDNINAAEYLCIYVNKDHYFTFQWNDGQTYYVHQIGIVSLNTWYKGELYYNGSQADAYLYNQNGTLLYHQSYDIEDGISFTRAKFMSYYQNSNSYFDNFSIDYDLKYPVITLPFYEGFESGSYTTNGWNITQNSQIVNSPVYQGNYSHKATGTPSSPNIIKVAIPSLTTGIYELSWNARKQSGYNAAEMTLVPTPNLCCFVYFEEDGYIAAYNGNYVVNVLPNYSNNVWYSFKVIFNAFTSTYDLYINQNLVATNFGLLSYSYPTTRLEIAGSAVYYVDNISFSEIPQNGTIHVSTYPVFPGLQIQLCDNSGQVIESVLSDSNGCYLFSDILPGNYIVSLTPPSGYIVNQNNIPVTVQGGAETPVSFELIQLKGIISVATNPAFPGLQVQLHDNSGQLIESVLSDSNGHCVFSEIIPGNYLVSLTPPSGYTVNQNNIPVSVQGGVETPVSFELIRLPGTIFVTINPAFFGLQIELYTETMQLLESVLSDSNGCYSFIVIDWGNYIVSLVEPLSFSANQNDIPVMVQGGVTSSVDFNLILIPATNNPQGLGFWKTNVNNNISGNGNPQYNSAQLLGFSQLIFDHFYSNPITPIIVNSVTYNGNPAHPLTLSEMQYILNINQGGSTMNQRAKQHYLTLLLNVASNRLGLNSVISADNRSASQAINFVNSLIGINDALAKSISETISQGGLVTSGIIPSGTPGTIFGTGDLLTENNPHSLKLNSPNPNPFNPSTTITFDLPELIKISLIIYNIQGKEVAHLADGWFEAGTHSVDFQAAYLTSGIYFARLTTGNFTQTQKLLLVK